MTHSPNDDESFDLSDLDGYKAKHAKVSDAAETDELAATDGQVVIRKRKKRKKMSAKKRALVILVSTVIMLALGSAAALGYSVYKASQDLSDYEEVVVETPEAAVTYTEGKTVEYKGHTYALNENMVSMVFVGFDKEAIATEGEATGQADAVMVLALDTVTGKVDVIAVPRDSMVDVDTYADDGAFTGTQTMQLCLAYNYGDGGATSCENVAKSVSRTLYGIPLEYYIALDENGIGPICEQMGGVALTALDTIPTTDIVEGEDVILTGYDAYKYVQYRDIKVLNSPIDRQERQKQFVSAFAAQTLSLSAGNIDDLVGLYTTAMDYSVTNLGLGEFYYLAATVVRNGVSGVELNTLTGEMVQGATYAEYHLDSTATYETVLNVYYTQID